MDTVASRLRWCSSLLDKGPLLQYTEQEYAEHLIEDFEQHGASSIAFSRLAFADVDLATVEVTGVWPGWQELVVEPGVARTVEAEQRGPAEARALAKPDNSAGQDLLSEFLGEDVPARGRGRGRGRGRDSRVRQRITSKSIAQ